jgi:hypothetical protein
MRHGRNDSAAMGQSSLSVMVTVPCLCVFVNYVKWGVMEKHFFVVLCVHNGAVRGVNRQPFLLLYGSAFADNTDSKFYARFSRT